MTVFCSFIFRLPPPGCFIMTFISRGHISCSLLLKSISLLLLCFTVFTESEQMFHLISDQQS